MEWKDVGQAIGKVAPVIGSILMGNIPGAIAGAASLIAGEFGCDATPDSVNAAIQADPQALVKLRELEVRKLEILTSYNVQVAQAQTAQFQAESQRIGQAQTRQVELAKQKHISSYATDIIAVVITVMFWWMLNKVVATGVDGASPQALLLLGALSTAFGAVCNYYLGSSLGSKAKDDAAFQLRAAKAQAPDLEAIYQRLLAQARGEQP